MVQIFLFFLVAHLPDFMTNMAEGSRMVPSLEFHSAILSSGNHIFELECLQWNEKMRNERKDGRRMNVSN